MPNIKRFSNPNVASLFAQNDIKNYTNVMVDAGLGRFSNGVTAGQANDQIRELMFNVLELTPDSNRKEIRRATRRHIVDVYEVIEDAIDDLLTSGWQTGSEFQDSFVEYRNLSLGDENQFFTKDNILLNVHKVSGDHHDIVRQKLNEGSVFYIPINTYAIKFYTEFELFMAGRIDWAAMILKVYESLDQHVNSLIYEAFIGMAAQVTPTAQFNKSGDLSDTTRDDFVELIEDVQAANRGTEVVIVGTKTALSKLYDITPVDWISNEAKNERHTMGHLGLWEGTRIIEIPQVFAYNDTTTKLVDNTKIMVMPIANDFKPVKVVYVGDNEIKEVTDSATNMDMTYEWELQTRLGVGAALNRKFGLWTLG